MRINDVAQIIRSATDEAYKKNCGRISYNGKTYEIDLYVYNTDEEGMELQDLSNCQFSEEDITRIGTIATKILKNCSLKPDRKDVSILFAPTKEWVQIHPSGEPLEIQEEKMKKIQQRLEEIIFKHLRIYAAREVREEEIGSLSETPTVQNPSEESSNGSSCKSQENWLKRVLSRFLSHHENYVRATMNEILGSDSDISEE
ncbi:MAG: hypothetical protein JW769_05265 [Parachlamydiales bacterium]|nr:hypothetical protein [Parachlamydiales bacterium]